MKLTSHPASQSSTVAELEATIERQADGRLYLWWMLTGDTRAIQLPEIGPAIRQDGLWKTTCFELFIGSKGGAYWEFNFSPSSAWAAYGFDGYRAAQTELQMLTTPEIEQDGGRGWFEFEVWVDLPKEVQGDSVAITAVIEEEGGHKSYWALAHAPGPPDFHNRDCFIAHLPPVEAP